MTPSPRHHLVVFAHPDRASFNGALLDSMTRALAAAGDTVEVSDLYAESFASELTLAELTRGGSTPPDVRREQDRVARADSLIFVFPVWWYDRPAILKGWCDRVLRPGFAYAVDPSTGAVTGLLGDRSATIVTTFGEREGEVDEDHVLAATAAGTFGYCGITDVRTLPLYGVPTAGDDARRAMLERAAAFVAPMRRAAS